MEYKGAALTAGGIGAWLYSLMIAATPVIQFIGACLGVVATGFAIYFYIKKALEYNKKSEAEK